jgi:hypothetical protein
MDKLLRIFFTVQEYIDGNFYETYSKTIASPSKEKLIGHLPKEMKDMKEFLENGDKIG